MTDPCVAESAEPLSSPIPLAGYSDKFSHSPIQGTIIKLTTMEEENNYRLMEEDEALKQHIPKLHSSYSSNTPGKVFLVLENCLHSFSPSANILDCKMGVRTFREEALMAARQNPDLISDLYQRMVQVDDNEPTRMEH